MAEVQQGPPGPPNTLNDPHYGDPAVKEHNVALAQHGLSAEERQMFRFGRAKVYYEQGLLHEAKRDLLIASRLDVQKNRVDILLLLAKVLAKEGHGTDVISLLTEIWQTPGTIENKMLIEQIVSVLVQVNIAAGGLPMALLIIEIGVLIHYRECTEDCRVGMLKLSHDLLKVNVPATQVPHLATIISRFYRATNRDEEQQLRKSIMNMIMKMAHVDVHAPVEQAVAVATLMPLLAGRLSDDANDQLFRVDSSDPLLSQGAFLAALEEFDVATRARLVRFSKRALDASADRQWRQKSGDTSDPNVFPHSRLIGTWSVLRRITDTIDDDGSLKRLQKK